MAAPGAQIRPTCSGKSTAFWAQRITRIGPLAARSVADVRGGNPTCVFMLFLLRSLFLPQARGLPPCFGGGSLVPRPSGVAQPMRVPPCLSVRCAALAHPSGGGQWTPGNDGDHRHVFPGRGSEKNKCVLFAGMCGTVAELCLSGSGRPLGPRLAQALAKHNARRLWHTRSPGEGPWRPAWWLRMARRAFFPWCMVL